MEYRWSPVSVGRKFTEFEVWIDLLLMANHQDRQVGDVYVKRGQMLRSQKMLAKRWKWDRKKVRNHLRKCQENGEIAVIPTTQFTLITICNYETYQGDELRNSPSNAPSTPHQLPTNNNVNNVNKGSDFFEKRESGELPFKPDYEIKQNLKEKVQK